MYLGFREFTRYMNEMMPSDTKLFFTNRIEEPICKPYTQSMDIQAADLAKVELPVQPQVSGTSAYVCPRIPKELIGHTELAYSGPKNPPMLYIIGMAPKEGHIVKQTINYSHRMPQDAFDSDTYVHVIPSLKMLQSTRDTNGTLTL